ncbi:hypothetical protein Golax_014398 [Gossypium laxum]|uniref:Uncharacterized protein n=1 Tax=Gossypium laxum TaxID=34288 RepID=A0A7J8ZUU1_9ROSI|nr:hypothetical protein [Gossypium laxum]
MQPKMQPQPQFKSLLMAVMAAIGTVDVFATSHYTKSHLHKTQERHEGVAIGIAIINAYDENSPTALIVEGLLNAALSGILIYMALVDLLAADFMNPKLQNNGILHFSLGQVLCLSGLFGLKKVSKKKEVPIKGLDYMKARN